ncbi:MAG TPA: TolC family protein [Ignavibacteria bacterium]|nr:TolC family protein [Ignavibacteria bacterium]
MNRVKLVSLLLLGIISAGCSSSYRFESEQPNKTPLIKKYSSELKSFNTDIVDKDTIDVLTLKKAVVIALQNNPRLIAYNLEIKALEKNALQQGLSPNPMLALNTENIFGSGIYSGFSASAITLLLSQDIMLAGKLDKRRKVAALQSDLAAWDYEKKRLDLITEVRVSFIGALTLQKNIVQLKELLKISNEFLSNVEKRIKVGKVSPAESSRAKVIVSALEIKLNNSEYAYKSVIQQLVKQLGSDKITFKKLDGKLIILDQLPKFGLLKSKLLQSPEIAIYKKVFEKQKAVIDLENAKAIPDLTISAGLRWLNQTSNNSFIIGTAIPLPIFNRNQGARQEAVIRLSQKKSEFKADKNKFVAELTTTYNTLLSLSVSLKKLNKESIPNAQNAFEIIRAGNLLGRFTILDVLDSQRTLFELQSEYLKTLGGYNVQLARLERLIGQNLETIN